VLGLEIIGIDADGKTNRVNGPRVQQADSRGRGHGRGQLGDAAGTGAGRTGNTGLLCTSGVKS